MSELNFDIVDPAVTEGEPGDRLRGWGQALARGFHEPRMDDERRDLWLEHARADDAVLRGAWATASTVADPAIPVATFASWAGTVNVGAGRLLDLHQISDVTVAPTHRRRGLLRTLMTADLDDAVRRGRPLAALTVSQGSIYGRFGFGPATRFRWAELDRARAFLLREDAPTAGGRFELVEPDRAWPRVAAVFERFHQTTRGSVSRPDFYTSMLSARHDWDNGGPDKKLRAVLHLDDTDTCDGYALYRHAGRPDGVSTVDVADLVALHPGVHLGLWRFLAEIDLVDRVRHHRMPLVDPLDWALVSPREVHTTRVRDGIWLRILNVATCLTARPWGADGEVVVSVVDPMGYAAGSWRVVTRDGAAEVTPTDAPGDIRLDVGSLGSLYLGDVDAETLRAAGRVTGASDAVAHWGAMCATGSAPYSATAF